MPFAAVTRDRLARAIAVTAAATALLVPAWSAPAHAHGGDGIGDTDYRVTITAGPDLPGVEVRVVEAGTRLELRNDGEQPVEILGYSGEPYLEVRGDGVWLNVNSPAAYLNETAAADATAPDGATPAATPRWVRGSDQNVVRWIDHRAHWMSEQPPAAVLADPDVTRQVLEWTIPLRSGVDEYRISGTVEWVAPPEAGVWGAVTLLLAAVLAAVVIAVRRPPIATLVPALAAAVAGAAAVADGIGRAVTAAGPEYHWLAALAENQAWPVACGLGGLAAAGYALLRRPGADLAVGLAGTLLVVIGLTRLPSMSAAITPTPWDGDTTRTLVVLILGLGAGLTAGSLMRVRRAASTRPDA